MRIVPHPAGFAGAEWRAAAHRGRRWSKTGTQLAKTESAIYELAREQIPFPFAHAAADFFCAARNTERNLCPTMISSAGLMVRETNSMWSGAFRSLGVGFGRPSRTVGTRLGLSWPSTSITGSPARSSLTQSLTL